MTGDTACLSDGRSTDQPGRHISHNDTITITITTTMTITKVWNGTQLFCQPNKGYTFDSFQKIIK